MIVVGTAHRMDVAIGGTAIVGVGGGLAELVGFAGIQELAPVRSRGKYMGTAFLFNLPFGAAQAYGTFPGNQADPFQLNYTRHLRRGDGVRGSQSYCAASTLSCSGSSTDLHLEQIHSASPNDKLWHGSTSSAEFSLSAAFQSSL